ncbi:hypothetical protein D3C72_1618590 [compost metagenome]
METAVNEIFLQFVPIEMHPAYIPGVLGICVVALCLKREIKYGIPAAQRIGMAFNLHIAGSRGNKMYVEIIQRTRFP